MDKNNSADIFRPFFFFLKYTFSADYYILYHNHGHGFYSCSLFNNLVILRIYQWNNVIKG